MAVGQMLPHDADQPAEEVLVALILEAIRDLEGVRADPLHEILAWLERDDAARFLRDDARQHVVMANEESRELLVVTGVLRQALRYETDPNEAASNGTSQGERMRVLREERAGPASYDSRRVVGLSHRSRAEDPA